MPKFENGKQLFNTNCAACHHPTKKLIASPFPFVRKKYGQAFVYKLVKNNFKLQAQNSKAKAIFKNKSIMTIFDGILTNKQIDEICDYVDFQNS